MIMRHRSFLSCHKDMNIYKVWKTDSERKQGKEDEDITGLVKLGWMNVRTVRGNIYSYCLPKVVEDGKVCM